MEDPQVIGINKEDYHTSVSAFAKAEASWIVSLNGKWKFHWSKTWIIDPQIFTKDYDASGWDDIVVRKRQMQVMDCQLLQLDLPFQMISRGTAEPPANYYSYENRIR